MTQPIAKHIIEEIDILQREDFKYRIKTQGSPEEKTKLDFVLWHNKRYPNHWFKIVYTL